MASDFRGHFRLFGAFYFDYIGSGPISMTI